MSLKQSASVLRLLVGLALGAGFVGFVTQQAPAGTATEPGEPVASLSAGS